MCLLDVFTEYRCPDCTEMLRRVEALNSDLTYTNTANARLSALNRQVDEQVRRLMDHLRHAVDERDALRAQIEAMTRDLIAVSAPSIDPMPGVLERNEKLRRESLNRANHLVDREATP